jgi:hypothetical protein
VSSQELLQARHGLLGGFGNLQGCPFVIVAAGGIRDLDNRKAHSIENPKRQAKREIKLSTEGVYYCGHLSVITKQKAKKGGDGAVDEQALTQTLNF